MTSDKEIKWARFNGIVEQHIKNYAVNQYGPTVGDSDDLHTAEDCINYIKKYVARREAARRGRLEVLRDLVKIAHFANLAFDFMKPTEEEIAAIAEGRTL